MNDHQSAAAHELTIDQDIEPATSPNPSPSPAPVPANENGVERPVVTFSTLAKVMGPMSLPTLMTLLKGHKYKLPGPRWSYQSARKQAINLLVDGVPLDPKPGLRNHEREAIEAMQRVPIRTPAWVRAVRPSSTSSRWELAGVTISMHPDVEFQGGTESGAAKLVFTKTPLAHGVGSLMAALLWHHRRNVLGITSTHRSKCVVYEPRLPWLHVPSKRPESQIKSAERACEVIATLWPTL